MVKTLKEILDEMIVEKRNQISMLTPHTYQ
jgi:hypothetical protein